MTSYRLIVAIIRLKQCALECNCVTITNPTPVPFSRGCAGVWFYAVLENRMCAECEGQLCACRPLVRHHRPEMGFVFPSEPQAAQSVDPDQTVFLWKRGLRDTRLHGFLSAVCQSECHSALCSSITGHSSLHTKTSKYLNKVFFLSRRAAPRPVTAQLQTNIMSS